MSAIERGRGTYAFPGSVKRRINASAKSIGPDQPARADVCRLCYLIPRGLVGYETKWTFWILDLGSIKSILSNKRLNHQAMPI